MAHHHAAEERQIALALYAKNFKGVQIVRAVQGPREVDPHSHTLEFSNGSQAVALCKDILDKLETATTEEEFERSFDAEKNVGGWDAKSGTFTPLTSSKRVIVEVLSGDSDGLVLDSNNPDEFEKVHHLMFMANNGKIGHGFKGASLSELFGLMDGTRTLDVKKKDWEFVNYYWVRERIEEGDTVLIRLFYGSKKVGPPRPKEGQA